MGVLCPLPIDFTDEKGYEKDEPGIIFVTIPTS